jgi:hypothetical protein
MKKNTARLLFVVVAVLLVSLAFQHRAQAFALTCPAGYTGEYSLQEGCCLSLKTKTSTLAYYEYLCLDGVPQGGNVTRICSATPCTL